MAKLILAGERGPLGLAASLSLLSEFIPNWSKIPLNFFLFFFFPSLTITLYANLKVSGGTSFALLDRKAGRESLPASAGQSLMHVVAESAQKSQIGLHRLLE